MPSSIAWLDTSSEQQRRVQDMIRLFAQQESRDELGIGQIRDVLSDTLFPGTSVLQTRARYFLIVPWTFAYAAERGAGTGLAARANRVERQLVEVLRATGDEGVIGSRAGSAVKNLPSAVFWSGLRRYGILARDVSPESVTGVLFSGSSSEADELAERRLGEWHPTLPARPNGFPASIEGGLALTAAEAEWLRDRLVERSRGSVLEHLLLADKAPDQSTAPWRDQVVLRAPADVASLARHAHVFSLMVHGAALLYNLLLRERYEEEVFNRVSGPVRAYEESFEGWLNEVQGSADLLQSWRQDEFWELIGRSPNNISIRTRDFVNQWMAAVLDGSAKLALTDPQRRLRQLVANREQSIKRAQSRLTNTKLLATWSGASGTGELVFVLAVAS